ncbi:hypothetical protein MHIB_19040 [Mycolicibacter hiberniae]|uniref:DUF4192 domain-containing protein n=2 Tax=Mycolicibacter hiberniae TaxID=29314 RepID=A0A7I7X177_9MYCO|nr:hypothetical protein MHIB_19040 [Mycolicibacter hiberniae]
MDAPGVTELVVTVAVMTTKQPDFTLNRPEALIAALPAILGFVPENSLVLVMLEGGELGSVLRVDLTDALIGTLGRLAEVAAAAAPAEAVAVLVDEQGAGCPACGDQHRELIARLTEELSRRDIALLGAHVVDRVARGGRWHCADGCGAGGPVDDPEASPLAVAAVLEGRRLYARRADLQAVVTPDDAVRRAAVAAAIADCAAERAAGRGAALVRARRDVAQVLAAIAALAGGQEPGEAELARLGCSLSDVLVRDTLCALAIGERAAEAELLWSTLARALPEPWRAEALVLLAFSAYARGDGPLAGVSLEAALRSVPGHRMAGLLDTALQSGLRPERIRGLADTGYRLGQQIGVRLPRRQDPDRRAG